MAEQKIEDTKPPVARRGARPFAGPAGAPSAARPLLRPVPPGARSTHAPFAPPTTGRPALGANPSVPQAIPMPPSIPVAVPSATPPVFDARPDARTDEVPLVIASVEPVPAERTRRPVTSEMVALDAFDAFDAVWNGPAGSGTGVVESQPASPLDEASLGSGDAPHPWAEDITATPDTSASLLSDSGAPQSDAGLPRMTPDIAMPVWLAEDIVAPAAPAVASQPTDVVFVSSPEPIDAVSAWPATEQVDSLGDWADAPSIPSADDVMASEPSAVEALGEAIAMPPVRDESAVTMAFAADESTESMPFAADESPAVSWPAPLLAEYAPYLATPPEASPSVTNDAIVSPMPAMAEPRSESGLRVSAALSRLAERVRDGEIDVSSVAPEATDAAVLASVLAALLGGSSSR